MSALTSPPLTRQSPSSSASLNVVSDTDSSPQSHDSSTDGTSVSGSEEEPSWTPGNAAIIGMACRVPGARNPQQLWKNIIEQKDVQRKIPKERFNVDAFYHPDGTNKGTTNAKYGYLLDDDISEFDSEFFQISGKEAESIDPQQRLLLEVVYEALENGKFPGITLDEISGTQTSAFCGSFTHDYREMIFKDLEHYPKAIIRGTGCNHDGTKECITMPNSAAQEALIRRVYKNSGLNTNDTSYFEAHGTGTQAGDPRELRAIGAVFAPNRDSTLYVGSVKTNIGHMEGASGLASIIKTTMSLEAGKILPNMHFNNPNPNIDFEQWKITVPTKTIDWTPTNGVRRASVNSFGYGGTNAHIILEGYSKPVVDREAVTLSAAHAPMVANRPYLIPLTSHTEKAGKRLKDNLSEFLRESPDINAADVAFSLSSSRISKHQYRSFAVGTDSASAIEKLGGSETPWTRASNVKPRIGYVFTGQGAQWFAMGRELIQKSPMFRQTIEKCDVIFQTLEQPPAWSCLTELLKSKEDSRVNGIEFSSSLTIVVQIAVIDLLRAWGVEPTAVCGHSAGEIPASYAAGILSFRDALACAFYRGCALTTEPANKVLIPGAMIAVGISEAESILEIEPYKGKVVIAALNSPTSLTLSGDEPEVVELKESLEKRKVFVRRLAVERAYHSHHMAPYGPELTRLLRDVKPRSATCRMFSSVTARPAEWPTMDGSYYTSNLASQVRYLDALTGILIDEEEEQAVDVLIEIGPHPALKGPSRQTIQSLKLDVPYLGTISRGEALDFEGLLACVGQLYAMGYPVNLEAVNSDLFLDADDLVRKAPAGRTVDLPSYSWDHNKYWAETRMVKSYRGRKHRHSILGAPVPGHIEKHPQWRHFLRPRELPWLPHHMIEGKVVFPAAGYLTMAIEAAIRLDTCPKDIKSISLRDIAIKSALIVSDSDMGTEVLFEMQPVSTSAKQTSDTWYRFVINSYGENGIVNEHCYGLISVDAGVSGYIETGQPPLSLAALEKRSDKCTPAHKYYERLAEIGLGYGEDFQLISGDINSGSGFSMAPITLRPNANVTIENNRCIVHPAFLDASFHPFFAGIESLMGRPLDGPFVPTFVKSMKISGAFCELSASADDHSLWACTETQLPGARLAITDVTIRSADCSEVLIDIKGLEATTLGSSASENSLGRSLFFRTRWQAAFNNLAGTTELAAFESIADVMDIFAHQHPNCKILHVTTDTASTMELLRYLGGREGQRRRFQSIALFSASEESVGDIEGLKTIYSSLIDITEPQAGTFDLVVLNKEVSIDVKSFLKPEGTIITNGVSYSGENMSVIFKNSLFGAYQEIFDNQVSTKPMTLVMPPLGSEKTEDLVSIIKATQIGAVDIISFDDLADIGSSTENVVVLASLDLDLFFEDDAHDHNRFEAVRSLLTNKDKNIVWVVKGASLETTNPAQAMILGMARVARNENEKLKIVTLDVAEDANNVDISEQILKIFGSQLKEDEIAARGGTLLIPRIETDDDLNSKLPENARSDPILQPFGGGQPLVLKIGKVGLLETLAFSVDEEIIDTELADDEIEIDVKASAVNFRDVAASIGIIDDYRLGDESSGVVRRVGRSVESTDFQIGDRVVAFRPGQGSHRSIVRNPAAASYNIGDIPFATAAAFTLVMTTAYYAFHDIARLQPGEKVLIHAAAGGVGQMAVQIAQMMGAEVIATCGSQAKRDLLKSTYGLTDDHIFSSRDSSFVKDVLNLTNGKGVDVILNSLAGDLLHATWNCIARFGRFVEIGKRDIHENSKIDMEPFRKSVSFASLDMITMYEYNKPLLHRILKESYGLLEEGKVKAPQTVLELPYSEVEKGFRLLQMGKHTGKVVLVPHEDDIVPVSQQIYRKTKLFSANKIYLLCGGLGGLGRTMAQWMVRKGARHLAFMSRSGDTKAEAKATVEWLGAQVQNSIKSLGDRLAGIFHAAVVLQDAPLNTMTTQQWQNCVNPKVQGAWNLHRATLHLNLDFFIPFSSISCQIGSMGQTNYSAANSYLDALVRYRRGLGLNASSMDCGMIVGIGLVSENDAMLQWLTKMGSDAVNEDELLYQIEEAVIGGSQIVTNKRGVDLTTTTTGVNLQRKDVYWHARSFFRNLYENHDVDRGSNSAKGGNSLAANLQVAANLEERATILTSAFIEKIAAVLGVAAETIQPVNPLSMYGLDSIVAVKFRKWFSKEINVEIALFDILSSKSISALVSKAAGLVVINTTVSKQNKDSFDTSNSNANSGGVEQNSTIMQSSDFDAISLSRPRNIPMSTFQRRMWFTHQMVEDKSALNIAIESHFKGTPDMQVFKDMLDELKKRNEMFRTSYFEGDDFAEQAPIEDFNSKLSYKDLSIDNDPDVSLKRVTANIQRTPLDIENGEVMKLALFKLRDEHFVFVTIFHHIAIDRGSSKAVFEQIISLYDALKKGKNLATVPPPRISYIDFAIWYETHLQSEGVQSEAKFWTRKLHGISPTSKLLPFAKWKRPENADNSRATIKQTIRLEMLKRLRRVCTRMGTTPFQFILAAFRAFLYRYTEEEDVTILVTDGNRPRADLEDVLGFFLNLIPIRLNENLDAEFDKLLGSTKTASVEAIEHSQIPFDSIVDAVNLPKSTSTFPISQIIFNYQMHGTMPQFATQDFEINNVVNHDIPTACEIALEAIEDPDRGLDLRLEFSTTLYSDEDMDRFFDNFSIFLTSLIQDHRQSVSEVKMTGPKELEYLKTNFWNLDFKESTWSNTTVVAKILAIAQATPNAVAVQTGEGVTLSYKELVDQARGVAGSLADIGQGTSIGILAHPGPDAIVAMVGTLFRGCGYLFLDPEFATQRLSFMASDSAVKLILVGAGLEDVRTAVASNIASSPQMLQISIAKSGNELLRYEEASADGPFYTVYTSGSTGNPKGVVLTTSNTQQMLSTMQHDYSFTSKDKFLHQSSMSFDLSIVQIFSALTCGGTVCVASSTERKDPSLLSAFIQEAGVTTTYFTPTHFSLLIEQSADVLSKTNSYRLAFFAGERLSARLVDKFRGLGTPATILNTWSPSELVVQTCIHKVSSSESENINIPIGYPMANCRHYIVDRQMNPVPRSVVGEICVGGAQVGAGYLNRPDQNATSFVRDPFCNEEDFTRGWQRMFRTGDKGRFLPDGQLEFHGRIAGDKQIKLRGFRVDLGEIEHQIFLKASEIPGPKIVDISMVARPLNGSQSYVDDRQLIAFIVCSEALRPGEEVQFVTTIHQRIGEHLNPYMLPNGYQFLSELPTTIGRKVNRQSLLLMDLRLTYPSGNSSGSELDANPSDVLKETLSSVTQFFREALKLTKERVINPSDNFFQLGGQSILLMRLQSKLNRKFKNAPTLPELFKGPTPIIISQNICGMPITTTTPAGTVETKAPIDWVSEAILPIDKQYQVPTHLATSTSSDITDILMTGVESFIGLHMFAAMALSRPPKRIHILGSEAPISPANLLEGLQHYKLLDNQETRINVLNQVVFIQGSLIEPRFGLSDAAFSSLGHSIQSIYHLGGQMSLLKDYSSLRRANAGATLDLIELASIGQGTEIQYLSTWSVPHLQTHRAAKRNLERVDTMENTPDHFQPSEDAELAYFKSRWVSEMLLTRAAERGLNANIFRASAVSGSTLTNVPAPDDDFVRRMILEMIELGSVPDLDHTASMPRFAVDFISVNCLADVLRDISTSDEIRQKKSDRGRKISVYHVGNPNPLNLSDLPALIPRIRADGKTGELVPLKDWFALMKAKANTEVDILRWEAVKSICESGHVMFALDRSETLEALRMVGGYETVDSCPVVDESFLRELGSHW
ncbi:Hybrid PKS-NRPS [Pseudogymnoascus sp. 24MN13]|nr:Hybrid PKS-NRPS [Pseudogymnoascus sp. 24MN13]